MFPTVSERVLWQARLHKLVQNCTSWGQLYNLSVILACAVWQYIQNTLPSVST